MLKKVLKKAVFSLVLLVLLTVAYSTVYNQPIRFRSKIVACAQSVYSLNPSSSSPDQLILCPSEDPSSGIRLSWRASKYVKNGEVQYWKKGNSREPVLSSKADLTILDSPELRTDRIVHHFSAALENLDPETIYEYTVGDPSTDEWSEIKSFTTAPERPGRFSFVYFGDTQASPVEFGQLLGEVDNRYRETAFYLIAGDLVEDGEWRYMWDSFAYSVSSVFSGKPVAPTLGNHDYRYQNGNGIEYFSNYFNTPDNGLSDQSKGRNYSFNYGNASFIVLDSNYDLAGQAKWLENQLVKNSQAKFKVVMFHHPPYHPTKNRDSEEIQKLWVPLLEKYGVDLVLSGHDHSYLRTKKLKNNLPVAEGEDGVVYVVSTSCGKFYDFESLPEAELQFGGILTYQRITIEQGNDNWKLVFKTFDRQHQLKDNFVLSKTNYDRRGPAELWADEDRDD